MLEVWDELEKIQIVKSKITSLNKTDIEEIFFSRSKIEHKISKMDKTIKDFEEIKRGYTHCARGYPNTIEYINNRIENLLTSKADLNKKLKELNKSIVERTDNSELVILKNKLNLIEHTLEESYHGLEELGIKIENVTKKGLDKSFFDSRIRRLQEQKEDIENKIEKFRSLNQSIPTFFSNIDRPIQRYILYGGEHSENFIYQSVLLLKQSLETKTINDLTEVNLPKRVIEAFKEWVKDCQSSNQIELNSEENNRTQGYKSPIIYFDYRGEIRVKFPSQILKLENCFKELHLLIISHETISKKLNLYHINNDLFESEEIDFEIEHIANKYEFQLIYGTDVVKSWEICSKIILDQAILVFDYDSKKLIQKEELPRSKVLIILRKTYSIKPEGCIFEGGNLYEKWNEYIYRGIDLSKVGTLLISSNIGTEHIIPIAENNPLTVILNNEGLLQEVHSDGKELYVGNPPTLGVSFKNELEIDTWTLFLYRKAERDFTDFRHYCLKDLKDIIAIDFENNLFKVPLKADRLLGKKAIGEVIVRLKNNVYNYDKKFVFCLFPDINIQFDESIYLPRNSGNHEIVLKVQLPEYSSFEVNKPTEIVSQRDLSLEIITNTSQRAVDGFLKYKILDKQIKLPISIHIPLVIWSLKGLKDNKYEGEFAETLEIPDEKFLDVSGENLLLKISFPLSIKGECTLRHQYSEQIASSKIKGNVAVFNILRFIDTVKYTHNSVQQFTISVQEAENKKTIIDNALIFSIRKWAVKNIICVQEKEGNKRTFQIKWDQEGSTKNACVILWQLKDMPISLEQISINGSENTLRFKIDESIVKPGRYLLHFTREDPWSQPIFPGENAPNCKEIYVGITESSLLALLRLANEEFEIGNYVKAIGLLREVSKCSDVSNVWIQKINNGLIYNHKCGEAINIFYHLLKNDKNFGDIDCFHIPSLLNGILNRQQDLKNEDLVAILVLLRMIIKNKNKYKCSSEKASSVIPKALNQIKNVNFQLMDDLQSKMKYVDPTDIEDALNCIRRF